MDELENIAAGSVAISERIWPTVSAALAGKGSDVARRGFGRPDRPAGHVVVHDATATAGLRDELLTAHVAAVRDLIPVNAKMMGTDDV